MRISKLAVAMVTVLATRPTGMILALRRPYWLDFPSSASYSDAMGYLARRC